MAMGIVQAMKLWKVDISLESTLNNSDSFIPDGIETSPNLSIGTAWDDFNINLETPSVAHTIHHTLGYVIKPLKKQMK